MIPKELLPEEIVFSNVVSDEYTNPLTRERKNQLPQLLLATSQEWSHNYWLVAPWNSFLLRIFEVQD